MPRKTAGDLKGRIDKAMESYVPPSLEEMVQDGQGLFEEFDTIPDEEVDDPNAADVTDDETGE